MTEGATSLRKLNILMVYDVSYPHVEGGGQRRMFEVARRLSAAGHKIDWLCFKTWNEDSAEIDISGIRYIGLPGFRGLYREDGSRRRIEPVEFVFALLRSKVSFREYDLVWSGQWPMLHLVMWLLMPNALGRTKLVVDWWEIWGDTWFRYAKLIGSVGYAIEKYLIKAISQKGSLILISPSSYREAKSMAPNGSLVLINNGIDFDLIKGTPASKVGLYDISYIGRLKDHKRVDLLINAISILRKSHGVILTAIIIGDGPEINKLIQLVNDLDLIGQVTFTGAISSNVEVYSLLKSSRVFVNPSTKEGGGSITLFEAFAAGLPVLAFKCKDGIDPDLLGDFVSGIFVEPVTADALASCLHTLMNNHALLASLQQGASKASANFSWDAIADRYATHFSSIVRSNP